MSEQPKSKAVAASGVLGADGDVLAQFQRWGTLDPSVMQETQLTSVDAIVERIRESMESDDALELRDTDLDAIRVFADNSRRGRMYLPDEEARSGLRHSDVQYCVTAMGEYLVPFQSEEVRDLLLHPRAYLKPPGELPVHVADIRELYYGDRKMFMVCTPAKEVEV